MFRFTDNERYARLFADIRPTPWWVMASYVILHSALLYIFFSRWFFIAVTRPVWHISGGWVSTIFLADLVELLLLVVGVILLAGGLRGRDLGLTANGFVNGFLIALLLWGGTHLVLVGLGHVGADVLRFNPHLTIRGGGNLVYRSFEATFGTALVEEIGYRGFLMPQIYLMLRHSMFNRPRLRLIIAASLPQLLFAINHIPAALRRNLDGTTFALYLLQVLLVGLFFAALYLRTGNLWIPIAVHSLINYPATVFSTTISPSVVVLVLSVILLLAWPMLAKWFDEVFTLTPLWREARRT